MPYKRGFATLFGGLLSALNNKSKEKKRGFTITEVLIALGIIAVIAVLILPVITTRAQNKSFALSYETEVKQMLNSLEGLPVNENKSDIEETMMYVQNDTGHYANNAGAYINKYMKVVKYCGDEPGDCFGGQYYQYKDSDRVEFDTKDIKGACALLKNGVSICLKPQIKTTPSEREEIQGWIDLNGPKGPNIYGRDLRTFSINLRQRAVFTEEEPTSVIVPDPPAPCEGDNCGAEEKDPCKINPRGEECCKREGFVASGKSDICCPWYRNTSDANHNICYPETPPCDPATDPNCNIDKCSNHAITGPADDCCAILEAQGRHDPNCCSPNSTSDYCCSVHPETEGCCKKNIESGKLKLTADSTCCKKYPAIYQKYSACKPACEQNNDSEQCCNTVSRRNEINNPDDACCMFEGVNGINAGSADNAYNKYCCRLAKNASEQCCKWKYEHIGSSLDYYAKHNYNQNDGTFDKCCHGDVRGIKYTQGKSDAKSQEVLKRCCTVNQEQSDKKEDELCCDYLVGQLGNGYLVHGQALRRCCQYENHKNKPQCCSHNHDGLASQTYDANVPYATQCCMPNSIYNNNVTPNINCCFDVPTAQGENDAFWSGKRWSGCCSYGDNDYKGHKANTEGQWQKNCCSSTRAKYPSDKTYNDACCVENAVAKSAKRDSWQYFSQTKNECCETLDSQYGENARNDNWTSHCCYGFKGGEQATKNPYYETEAKCCKLSGNWTEGCCKKSGLDKKDEKWKKNCCSIPSSYSNNVEYRKYCCFDSDITNAKAKDTDNDYTRNSDNADNPSGKNSTNVNNNNNRQFCCDPNIADTYTTENNGQTFKWTTTAPSKSCCEYFQSKGWMDNDNQPLSLYYKAACCQAHNVYDSENFTCEEKWMCGKNASYGIPGGLENTCCMSDYTYLKKDVTTPDVWRPGCCDFPTKYTSNEIYRGACCEANTTDYTRKGKGNTSENKKYCCHWDAPDPSVECCKLFKNGDGNALKINGDTWQDWDGKQPDADYKRKCCEKSTTATGDTNYCPNSCEVRWLTSEAKGDVNYDYSRCCTDRANQAHTDGAKYKKKAIWQNNCCSFVGKNPVGENGYASYADYRTGCCKPNTEQTFKDTNDGTNQNDIYCCIPNSITSYNKADGTYQGITPSEACCKAFKDNAPSSDKEKWLSHDNEVINDAYKTVCCQKYGICPDNCTIRSNSWNNSQYNLPTCCKEAQALHYKDEDQVWRKACCDGSLKDGTSSLNTLEDADYRKYCCTSAGASEGTLKSGNEDKRCCVSADGNTKLRNQKCCSNVPANRNDRDNIGFHCDCKTGANTWQVVNTKYQEEGCCTSADVLTSADKSITKDETTRKDWQSLCCSKDYIHKTPANNTIRDRHYSYCCNTDNGPYKDKSTWLNSTCCKIDGKTSANANTEGVDWNNVTTVSACCYYLEDYPNETCCNAKMGSDKWDNATSTRDSGYKKACCNNVDSGKYCSCGSKLDKNIATSDTCCEKLKATDNGKARWQADCCKYRTSYPSYTDYRSNCCSSDGVNNTKSNPSSNNNDAKYCCNPTASKPTKACCKAFKDNNWKDWESTPNAISNDYRIYCCQQYGSASDDYCDDCALRSKTNNNNGQWNLSTCCFNETMYADHKTDETWKKSCCPVATTVYGKANRKISDADFKQYCCKPANITNSANDTGLIYADSTTYNKGACCNTYTLGQTCCGSQGFAWDNTTGKTSCCNIADNGTVTDYCCKYASDSAGGAGAVWASEKYHKKCCDNDNKYCNCAMRRDASLDLNVGIAGETTSNQTCCTKYAKTANWYDNANFQSSCCKTFKDNQANYTNWKDNCCKNGVGNIKGTTDLNATCCYGEEPTDANNKYCCVTVKRDSQCTCENVNGKLYNGNYLPRCCDQTTITTENDSYCCKLGNDYKDQCACIDSKNGEAVNNNWFKRCCDKKTVTSAGSNYCCNVGSDYEGQCTCSERLRKKLNLSSACCKETNASRASSTKVADNSMTQGAWWQNQCCASTNPGDLNSSQFQGVCCSADMQGSAKGGGNINWCCNDTLGNWSSYCCKEGNINQCQCSDGKNGGADNGNWLARCCDKKTVTDANNNYCCNLGTEYEPQCTCAERLRKKLPLTAACCKETNASRNSSTKVADGSITQGAWWQSQCCASTNPGELNETQFKDVCCSANMQGSAKGGGNITWCCNNTLGNWSSYCCNKNFDNQCECTGGDAAGTGRIDNGKYDKRCCDKKTRTGANNDFCCKQGAEYNDQCYCKDNYGHLRNDNRASRCCTNKPEDAKVEDQWCCTDGNSPEQCDCSNRLKKKMELNLTVGSSNGYGSYGNSNIYEGNCCDTYKNKTGWYSDSHFASKCCKKYIGNENTYTDFSKYCCSGDKVGGVIGASDKTKVCCSNNTNNLDSWCCAQGIDNQCACAGGAAAGTGKMENGKYDKRCCDKKTKTGANNDFCCKQGYNDQCYCKDNYGHLRNDNRASRCCTNKIEDAAGDQWCCTDGNSPNQCNCTNRRDLGTSKTMYLELDVTVGASGSYSGGYEGNCCANYKNKTGWYDNEYFRAKCCKKYINSESSYTSFTTYCCTGNNIGGVYGTTDKSKVCCSGNKTDLDTWCCSKGKNEQCNCTERLNKNLDLDVSIGSGSNGSSGGGTNCCAVLAQSNPTNSHVKSQCCTKYMSDRSNYKNWSANCCAAIKDTNSNYKKNSWQTACCPSPDSNYTGWSTEYTSGYGDYATYCCNSSFNGSYKGGSSTTFNKKCCRINVKGDDDMHAQCCRAWDSDWYCTCNQQWTVMSQGPNRFNANDCCSSLASSYGSDDHWKNKCCSTSYITDNQKLSYCCSFDNLNSIPNSVKAGCCSKLYSSTNKPSNWKNNFSPGTSCCDALSVNESTGYGSDGKYYPECVDPCQSTNTYSGGMHVVSNNSPAVECCENEAGFAATNWKEYCCPLQKGDSTGKPTNEWWYNDPAKYYNSDIPNKYCCDKRTSASTGVYNYVPSKTTELCTWGGEANKCADYKYPAKGFYCGSENSCKAWGCQGDSNAPSDLSNCCSLLKTNNTTCYTNRQKPCCENSTFRNSSSDIKLECCNYFYSNYKSSTNTTIKKDCCKNSTFKNNHKSSGDWCYEPPPTPTCSATDNSYDCCVYNHQNRYNTSSTEYKTYCCNNYLNFRSAHNASGDWCYTQPNYGGGGCYGAYGGSGCSGSGVHILCYCDSYTTGSRSCDCTVTFTARGQVFNAAHRCSPNYDPYWTHTGSGVSYANLVHFELYSTDPPFSNLSLGIYSDKTCQTLIKGCSWHTDRSNNLGSYGTLYVCE